MAEKTTKASASPKQADPSQPTPAPTSGVSTQQGMGFTGAGSDGRTVRSDKNALRAGDFNRTQDLAVKATPKDVAKVSGPQINPSIEQGQDKAFNSWVRAAHESGNPEQYSPMQAAQNIRDKARGDAAAPANLIDDANDEDTRWVAENVKGEPVRTDKQSQ